MSHFTVLVVLPPTTDPETSIADVATDVEGGLLAEALSFYDENREDAVAPKWDWWTVGGRWRGELPIKEGASPRDVVATTPRYPDIEGARVAGFCDAARVRAIDFDAKRDAAERKAGEDWDTYHRVIEGTPEPTPWSEFCDRVDVAEIELFGMSWRDAVQKIYAEARAEHLDYHGSDDDFWSWIEGQGEEFCSTSTGYKASSAACDAGVEALKARRPGLSYDVERARVDYGKQDRVRRVRESVEYHNSWDSPIESIGPWSRSEFMYRQRTAAVPGFATLVVSPEVEGKLAPTDTQWIAAGEMGWFGMSSDTPETKLYYQERINELIDGLSPEHVIVMLDCHI